MMQVSKDSAAYITENREGEECTCNGMRDTPNTRCAPSIANKCNRASMRPREYRSILSAHPREAIAATACGTRRTWCHDGRVGHAPADVTAGHRLRPRRAQRK